MEAGICQRMEAVAGAGPNWAALYGQLTCTQQFQHNHGDSPQARCDPPSIVVDVPCLVVGFMCCVMSPNKALVWARFDTMAIAYL